MISLGRGTFRRPSRRFLQLGGFLLCVYRSTSKGDRWTEATPSFMRQPPPGLFPPSPPPPSSASSSSPSSSSTNPSGSNATSSRRPQTLIDRFDLTSRVAKGKDVDRAFSSDPITGAAPTTTKFAAAGNASKWEATAEAREASLKRRKEEMVLEARR